MRAVTFALVISVAAAFVAPARFTRTTTMMSAEAEGSRREFAVKVAAAAAAVTPMAANARIDYEGVKYLGGGDVIDLNNANVRAYLRLKGMYPTIAGKIVSNKTPFKTVADVYNLPGLTAAEKDVLKGYEKAGRFTVLEPAAEYMIDRINNGLYR